MEKCGKEIPIFSFLTLFFSPPFFSRFSTVIIVIIVAFLALHVHISFLLFRLTKSQGGEAVCDFDYRLFFFFFFFFSLFLFDRGRKKSRCKKEQGCDNTYSISIWKRQQVDGISSQNITVKPAKQKLYYPIERTRA